MTLKRQISSKNNISIQQQEELDKLNALRVEVADLEDKKTKLIKDNEALDIKKNIAEKMVSAKINEFIQKSKDLESKDLEIKKKNDFIENIKKETSKIEKLEGEKLEKVKLHVEEEKKACSKELDRISQLKNQAKEEEKQINKDLEIKREELKTVNKELSENKKENDIIIKENNTKKSENEALERTKKDLENQIEKNFQENMKLIKIKGRFNQ